SATTAVIIGSMRSIARKVSREADAPGRRATFSAGGSRMTDGSVLYHRHESIVTLTLNRPETLNAMNEPMMGEIERILIELEADPAVRVVTLTGAGRAFSSGGDQKRDPGAGQQPFFDGDL